MFRPGISSTLFTMFSFFILFVQVPSHAATLRVPADYGTIQGAIDAASAYDEVVVGPGVYYGRVLMTGVPIVLRSTDPEDPAVVAATVLDATGLPWPVVAFNGNETSFCSLAGFTLRHGRSALGAGIAGNLTRATIRHCWIVNNTATQLGSAVHQCRGSIEDCTIAGNRGGRGGLSECSGQVRNCVIADNHAEVVGGGLYACNGIVDSCTISGNVSDASGGGVVNCNRTIITNSIIANNTAALEGGGIYNCIYLEASNNIIAFNHAGREGGGMAVVTGGFANNLIYGNGNDSGLPAGVWRGMPGSYRNNIIWGNMPGSEAQVGQLSDDKEFAASYSCIEGGYAGGGNIDQDPRFVNPEALDFHLRADSPCIDAGRSISGLKRDIAGHPRPFDSFGAPNRGDGSTFDMGVYEMGILVADSLVAGIAPEAPQTLDDLVCTATAEGLVADASWVFAWYRNGQPLVETASETTDLRETVRSVLSHDATAKNETYFCHVEVDNGFSSRWVRTAVHTIQNTPPTPPAVIIVPENPQPWDGLGVEIVTPAYDADDDPLDYRVNWYRSSDGGVTWTHRIEVSGVMPQGSWVPPAFLHDGDVWRVEVVAFESRLKADAEATAVEEAELIESEMAWCLAYVGDNHRPLVTLLSPAKPTFAVGEVALRWETMDADGDPVTVDLYCDTDERPGGEILLASGLPGSGVLHWLAPGADKQSISADVSGDGAVGAEDLLRLARAWQGGEATGAGFTIMARAFDARRAMDQKRSAGVILVPEALPATREGLLRLIQDWKGDGR